MNSSTSMFLGRAFHHLTAVLMVSAASAGCAQQGTASELEFVQLTENAADEAPALEPFASIQLDSGRRVDFVDLGDGDIGIGEVGPIRGESVVGVLTRDYDATPLEVFLALNGDTREPPALLVEAHAAMAAQKGPAATSPRKLPGEQSLVATGVNPYPAGKCGTWLGTSWYWVEDWTNTYEATRDVVAASYLEDEDLTYPIAFYAGGNLVTAANMGICVDDHWYYGYNSATDEVRFKVFAKSSGTASGCGGTAWGTALYNVLVDQDESANFYTSSAAGKLVCATAVAKDLSTDIRDIGIGTAYDKPMVISN